MTDKAIASNAPRANPTNLNEITAKEATRRVKAMVELPPGKNISPSRARRKLDISTERLSFPP